MARLIEEEYNKDSALSRIAGGYAKAGFFSKALEVTKRIKDESDLVRRLTYIAVEYAKAGQEPSQQDVEQLSDILHIKYPPESFWK